MAFVRNGASALILMLALGTAGCAYLTAVPTNPQSNTAGIRVPEVKPLLVVGSQVSVILAPNPNRETAVQFGSFLAKNDTTVELSQGLLQSIISNQDSTAVPVAFLSALGQAAASGHSLFGAAYAGTVQPQGGILQIYDIEFDDAGNLVGLRPLLHRKDLMSVPAGSGQLVIPQPPATPTPKPSPTPSPSASPTPKPTPKPTPGPTPIPTPLPGN